MTGMRLAITKDMDGTKAKAKNWLKSSAVLRSESKRAL